ncbi:methyltransferase, TIGR04325 family [Afipia sp. TerB]
MSEVISNTRRESVAQRHITAKRVYDAVVRRSPWFMRECDQAIRTAWARRRQPFSGIYERYEDVPASTFYDTEVWAKESAAITKAVRAGTHVSPNVASRALLPAVIAATPGPVHVLDFGGCTGIDFAFATAGERRDDLSYTVVDTPAACAAGERLWADDNRVRFMPDMPPNSARFDVVYSCVALHTLPDPMAMLRRFIDYRPRTILLVRHPFADRAFVRQQVNMATPLAQWVLSLPAVCALMKEAGYSLSLNVESEDCYNVDNFPPEYAVPGTRNLMFVRQAAETATP